MDRTRRNRVIVCPKDDPLRGCVLGGSGSNQRNYAWGIVWKCSCDNRLRVDVNPDADLVWRELIPRVRFHSSGSVERRGANTLPLSGTRQAMWHLSKRCGEEVGDVAVVVSEAPRDKVWEEVKGAG